ncbi:Gfo/Idh/MocA family protein [Aureimonas jatrophae]|uniref:Predicted dehydrogenase n=1 Tax=Aureimonas jatrophae TaxID=1166073 RepID=A0A1H0CAM4_9HYPH|nr:Gfo/Idh/MocA family oxidoreductase [Aureimonas jatrophae]MBB3949145.1 putative dehydrogenase [Aureimonas jatrophae]SDN54897.1 Predicted dehydrogenase [Aureimonas jatrophae]
MLRWGIMSGAKIAREQVIPAVLKAEGCRLEAIASRDRSRAETLALHFGAPHAFGSYEAMLESPEVDAVYIPLPTSQHVEWTLKAIEAGKHVLVEKPLALHADQIQPLIEARDQHGVQVAEAFMVRYHPQWLLVRRLIEEGRIGRLRHVQGAFSYHNVDPANMRNQVELGGGALPDIGVYPVVTTRLSTGLEPVSARARIERDARFGTDIFSECEVDFGAFRLSFYLSTQLAARQTMVFHGTDGFIEVDGAFNAGLYAQAAVHWHDQNHGHAESWRFGAADQYRLQAEAFARVVAGSDERLFSLEESVLNQRVIDALYASDRNKADAPV